MGASSSGSPQQVAQQQQAAQQQPADPYAQSGGGLMFGGVGQPLRYVPPSLSYQQGAQANAGDTMNSARTLAPGPGQPPPAPAQWDANGNYIGGAQPTMMPPPPPPPGQGQPGSDNGQGFTQGPTAADGGSPFANLTPQQTALLAMQAQTGQTAGGLMPGPNHTLVRAPQAPQRPMQQQPANGAEMAQMQQGSGGLPAYYNTGAPTQGADMG